MMRTVNILKPEALQFLIDRIVGKKILKVNAGNSAGSIFSLEFGDELIKVEKNGYTFFVGDYCIMVHCAWRLFDINKEKPVTGWHENSDENGIMTIELRNLVNDSVEKVSVDRLFDLDLQFKSGKLLSIFCDLTPYVNGEENWFFGSEGKYYSVNHHLVCREEVSKSI